MARMTLDQLVSQLRAAHGDGLRAVVLYGSAATDDFVKDVSDYNTLVVAEGLEVEALRAVGAVIRAWVDSGQPAPLLLTTEEWTRSADIFPMEYSDLLERHRILHGTLPMEGVVVHRDHLRLQLEHQAMGKLLALRQGVLAAAGDRKRQLEVLQASRSAVMVVFRAVMRLEGLTPPADSVELVRKVGALAGFSPDPFERVVRHVRREQKIAPDQAGDILAEYLRGVQSLVRWLDQHAGAGTAPIN